MLFDSGYGLTPAHSAPTSGQHFPFLRSEPEVLGDLFRLPTFGAPLHHADPLWMQKRNGCTASVGFRVFRLSHGSAGTSLTKFVRRYSALVHVSNCPTPSSYAALAFYTSMARRVQNRSLISDHIH